MLTSIFLSILVLYSGMDDFRSISEKKMRYK